MMDTSVVNRDADEPSPPSACGGKNTHGGDTADTQRQRRWLPEVRTEGDTAETQRQRQHWLV